MYTSREFMGQGGIEMIYRCRDCGAEQLHVPPNQLNQRCLLCDFGVPAAREPWLMTVSVGERQLALQHARELRAELGEKGAGTSDSVEPLTAIERQFWAVGCLIEAVHESGFELFFRRYSFGIYADAIRGLDAMAACIAFSLLSKARRILTDCVDLPDDATARGVFLASNWTPEAQRQLDKLRQKFCTDAEDVEALWYEFGLLHGLFQYSD